MPKTLYLGREPQTFTPGQELVLESFFQQSPYGVVFEDDCGTGYCRNAFPEPYGSWLREPNRLLTDELLDRLLGV